MELTVTSPDTCKAANRVRISPRTQRHQYLATNFLSLRGNRRTRSPQAMRRVRQRAVPAPLRHIAGNLRLVDGIDLAFVHILVGEFKIDLVADEDIEQVR